jgi:uncharacterized membrane protein YeaQ/YmgE (transglycosylase-associated protein family)
MLHYLWMLIVGIVTGLIARFVLPGADQMGLLMTGVLGIAGSFVGGAISRLFSKPADGSNFHAAGFLMSIIGAVLLLLVWRFLGK